MSMLIVAALGFFLGTAAVSALTRWAQLVYEALSQHRSEAERASRPSAVAVAICQSLFHAGPWSVAAFVFVAYHLKGEPWAPWLLGGFVTSFLLMGSVAVQFVLRIRNARRETAVTMEAAKK